MTKPTSKPTGDSKLIHELAEMLNETGLSEIEYEKGGMRIRVARGGGTVMQHVAAPPPAAAPAPSAAEAAESTDYASHPGVVTAPMVGVVYEAAEPGAAAFVKIGDQVSEGDTLFLIEAMKTFNPVRAPKSGKVARILVSNGSPVEFGEPLLILE